MLLPIAAPPRDNHNRLRVQQHTRVRLRPAPYPQLWSLPSIWGAAAGNAAGAVVPPQLHFSTMRWTTAPLPTPLHLLKVTLASLRTYQTGNNRN